MDEIEALRRYAERSYSPARAKFDVTCSVLATIRRGRPERPWLAGSMRPLITAAAASILLAVSLGFWAQQSIAELQDPLTSLFTPFVVAIQ